MKKEFIEKKERLVELMSRENLGGVLINSQHNFAWLTGGAFNGIDQSRENGAATLLVTAKGNTYLLANNIELERVMTEQLSDLSDIKPIGFSWQEEKADAAIAIKTANGLAASDVVSDIALHPSTRSIEGLLAPLRYSLTEDEADRYTQLGQDTSNAVLNTINRLAIGETETEIDANLRQELAKKKITSVVTLVAADQRISQYRHPVPSENKFHKTLLLVTCAKRGGLIASMSRMVSVGEPSGELVKNTEAAAYVNACLLSSTRPGATSRSLYETAARAYAERGFDDEINLHHQGGATGYRTREWVAHPLGSDVIKKDQAFAWNPSITGTKIEDTVLIGEEGGSASKCITGNVKFPVIESYVGGEVYLSPGIVTI